ncbi:MAG: hypothetical protein H7Y20_04955 [Bryobacteraceae bacterium]|nr:hypothetical protein [Bryobacteraceae bacterium]
MKAPLVFLVMLTHLAAQTTAPDGMATIHNGKGVIVRAPENANWCTFGAVRLQLAVLEPETRNQGKAHQPITSKEHASARVFLERLDADLKTAFAEIGGAASPNASRTMVVVPRLRKLSPNNLWLNVIGLAALQTPLKGSGMMLELALSDDETGESVGSALLVGKGFWASQVDLNRYRYSISRLGQAQAIAKSRGKEAARQIDRLMGCDTAKLEPPRPSSLKGGAQP